MKIKLCTYLFLLAIIQSGCGNHRSPKLSAAENVDYYLSQNKFQEALESAAKSVSPNQDKFKVLKFEFRYFFNKKDLGQCISILNEEKAMPTNESDDFIGEYTLNKVIYENYLELVRAFCENGQIDKAKKITYELPKSVAYDERIEHISGYGDDNKSEQYYIRNCRRKYNAIKKALKSNEEIEAFKETEYYDYTITTYEYPREQAMKILEEYKGF